MSPAEISAPYSLVPDINPAPVVFSILNMPDPVIISFPVLVGSVPTLQYIPKVVHLMLFSLITSMVKVSLCGGLTKINLSSKCILSRIILFSDPRYERVPP